MASLSRTFKEAVCSIPLSKEELETQKFGPAVKNVGGRSGSYPVVPSSFNKNNPDVPSYLTKLAKVMNTNPNDDTIVKNTVISESYPLIPMLENDEYNTPAAPPFGVAELPVPNDNDTLEFIHDDVIAEFMINDDMGMEEDEEDFFSENSFQSFNIVNMLLNNMEVKNHEKTNSDSSKRKPMEVDDDTASSVLKGSKKMKK